MNASRQPTNLDKFTDEVHRAFQEYLKTTTVTILVFVLLGIVMAALEQSHLPWVDSLRTWISAHMFGDADATRDILTATAATLITVTSITFTVLLLAVQQAAGAMSTQIIDQFLRRPANKIVFGYFVGMSIYTVVVLATVRSEHNPVLSTLVAFVFAALALYVLAALVYVTLTQMRPAVVIQAIHDATLDARQRQLELLRGTQRLGSNDSGGNDGEPIRSRGDGYITNIDIAGIASAIATSSPGTTVALRLPIGSYVALHDEVAVVHADGGTDTSALGEAVLRAIRLGRVRDLERDPAHGVDEIHNIGWTTISTAKHSPSAGSQAIHALRDLVSAWADVDACGNGAGHMPITYPDDVVAMPLRALESLGVAATESRQHQNYALVLRSLALMLPRLPVELRSQAAEMIPRLLARIGEEVLTAELDATLFELAATLEGYGLSAEAESARSARRHAQARVRELGFSTAVSGEIG